MKHWEGKVGVYVRIKMDIIENFTLKVLDQSQNGLKKHAESDLFFQFPPNLQDKLQIKKKLSKNEALHFFNQKIRVHFNY